MNLGSSSGATLVTGASGFLGSLVAAALLASERRRVVLPLRPTSDPTQCRQHVRQELLDYGVAEQEVDILMELVSVIELPTPDRFDDLNVVPIVQEIDEIIHCAGCVDYFDEPGLRAANVDLTARLLRAGRGWGVRRFIYMSTAYCAGYRSDLIPERLHSSPAPSAEPTAYTKSKRIAEWLVAESGIPFLIVRPSIVIGNSKTGKYTGKNYGLYQMWRAIEGLLCREFSPVWYTIAPPVPLNLVHQDAFQSAFLGAYRRVDPEAIIHVVSHNFSSPTLQELCWLWADVYRPLEIRAYAKIDQVPLDEIPRRQRRFLELTWKNFEIATQPWTFETKRLNQLRAIGLEFTDVTIETVAKCQQRYIDNSPTIKNYIRQHGGKGVPTQLVELYTASDFPPASSA